MTRLPTAVSNLSVQQADTPGLPLPAGAPDAAAAAPIVPQRGLPPREDIHGAPGGAGQGGNGRQPQVE